MRTATSYSPTGPAGEQGPLGVAPSAFIPTYILPRALLLPQRDLTLCHLSPPTTPALGHLSRSRPDVAMTPAHSLGIPRSGPSPVPRPPQPPWQPRPAPEWMHSPSSGPPP